MNIYYAMARTLLRMRPSAIRGTKKHPESSIGSASQVVDSELNRYSYCGSNCVIVKSKIGCFTSIADNVIIGGAAHAMAHVSTSPIFHVGRNSLRQVFSNVPAPCTPWTFIGHDVWIGHGAKIASGIKIGDGAIVGMGAVVTKNVAAYTIVGGVPAKFLRNRFPPDISRQLAALRWWEWDVEMLKRRADLFSDPENLIEACK